MKLRVKATGETLEIPQDSFVCGVRPDGNDVEFMVQEVEIIPDYPDYWEAFRIEAAKDILAGMVSHPRVSYGNMFVGEQSRLAIQYTDELIKQLKEDEK